MRTLLIILLLVAIAWGFYYWRSQGRLPLTEAKPLTTGDQRLDKLQTELRSVELELKELEENAAAKEARSGYVFDRYKELLGRREDLRLQISRRLAQLTPVPLSP